MQVTLIGAPNSKRTIYFQKAAQKLGIEVCVMPHNQVRLDKLAGTCVKIDPPGFDSCYVDQLGELLAPYKALLHQLADAHEISFFNHPKGILHTLNKEVCKKTLEQAHIPVTPVLASGVTGYFTLKELMRQKGVYSVFLKPIEGSGACGVIAYRYHPHRHQAVAYTGLYLDGGRLVNTKEIRRITQEQMIDQLCSRVMELGAVVEVWQPKDQHQGRSYDLRVVHQFGEMAYCMPRLSHTPITNLHLNNQGLPLEQLDLPQEVLEEVAQLCARAMACYDGWLTYAGIDILLEKDTRKPYIIEMNGQGDLLYHDIYGSNRIYTMQLQKGVRL